MEDDRELTNLGPETAHDTAQDVETVEKQPRKRFIGRRPAAQSTSETERSGVGDGTIQAPKTSRVPRTLNQIPHEILKDPSINEAISHLPANYNFEIHKTIHRIRSSGSTNIALQFPEGLLMFAPLISDILTQFCPGTEALIMGDVTYGACCIDDYTARALGCDLLVHYGHSCLVPVDTMKGIKTLYVFVTIGIDVEHLIATVERNFQPGKKIALVGTIQFNATLHNIVPRLKSLGYETVLPRSAPLSAGEILGCTAPTLTSRVKSSSGTSISAGIDADTILYVGDGRFHLESIMIASPSLRAHTYRYDPYTRRLTHEFYEHEEMYTLRRNAIETARRTLKTSRAKRSSSAEAPTSSYNTLDGENGVFQPQTWGIILGTLGRQGNPHTLSLITAHLRRLGIPYITLLLSEIQPTKLALMSNDVGVWVQIACPRLSIDWGYAFERPLLSPFEALVALDVKESGGWDDDGIDSVSERAISQDHDVGDKSNNNEQAERSIARELKNGVYPMDFYSKQGLGRTKLEDIPDFEMEIEVK